MTAVARMLPLPLPAPVVPPRDGHAAARKVRKQAWMALHFTAWPLYALLHSRTAEQRLQLATQPLVVLDQDRQRRVLVANDRAQSFGIRVGHTFNAALALCAELKFLLRDVQAEAALLRIMAAWAQRYTPVVSVEAPNELLLEVRGSLRLFGGVQSFICKVQQALQAQQLSAALALSPTARASLCLARGMVLQGLDGNASIATPRQLRSLLAALPVACLHWPTEIQVRLLRCGIRQIGELWRLPRADLARRIGKQHLRELDALLGKQPEVRAAFRQIPPYTDRLLLDFEITGTSLLEPLLLRALQRLQMHLRERDLALGRLYIELRHRAIDHKWDGACPATRLCLGLAMPSGEMQRMAVVLRERLAHLQLEAPVQEIRIHAPQLLAAQGKSQDLWAGSAHNRTAQSQVESLACLLERLQARLGNQTVRCLQLRADHRPERAQSLPQVNMQMSHVPAYQGGLPVHQPLRPLWLSAPLTIATQTKLPAEWQIVQGPERIETGWWDAAPMRRDYYVARYRDQAWGWIFKDLQSLRWCVHGWFA